MSAIKGIWSDKQIWVSVNLQYLGYLDLFTCSGFKVFEAARENEDFNAFLVDPVTSRQKKMEGVESLLSDMGVCDITKNFFRE